MNAIKLKKIEHVFSDPTILKQYINCFKTFFANLSKKDTKYFAVKSLIPKIFKKKSLN